MADAPKLRVREVVERYGLTERHVRQLVADRAIPFYKVGRVLLFDRTELDTWLDNQKIEAN